MRWQAHGWLAGIRRILSPNQGARPADEKVSLIVLHNISLPPDEFSGEYVEQFFVNRLDGQAHPYFAEIVEQQVSAHFYLRRSGRIIQFVSADQRAWHAGRSTWAGRENCNDYSIGIELEGCDTQPFSVEQYEALWPLLDALRARYPIAAIAGHCNVAPGRKTDPGPFFDWPAVRQRYPGLALPAEIML
jgi:AmpD protein